MRAYYTVGIEGEDMEDIYDTFEKAKAERQRLIKARFSDVLSDTDDTISLSAEDMIDLYDIVKETVRIFRVSDVTAD